MNKIKGIYQKALQSALIKNSALGVLANILQTVFVSFFFVVIARVYPTAAFAQFLVATTVYQLIAAFSSMGLGQWFIREYNEVDDKALFTGKFVKIQACMGLCFYLVNIALALLLYADAEIVWLCIVLGTNIIFDNVIYALKNLNIAEFKQQKTLIVLTIDGFLRMLLACVLFVFPMEIISLSVVLIFLRFITVNLFIKMGSSNSLNIRKVWNVAIARDDFKKQIFANWRFVVIGSVSIVYWRIANIIISKLLTLEDVANYEISFRIFSLVMILPTIVSATVFTRFVQHFNDKAAQLLQMLYRKIYLIYSFFAILAYAFIYSFADLLLFYAFGDKYLDVVIPLQEMFLTMLLFPTVLLQANLIVAMKAEKIDMYLNLISLGLNVVGCFVGLYFYQSISVVNYAIFGSFLVFHVSQNIYLISNGITTVGRCLSFYTSMAAFIFVYQLVSRDYSPYWAFAGICLLLLAWSAKIINQLQKGNFDLKPSEN